MKNLPRQLQHNLAPLLLALAVSQSYAVEVIVAGDAGAAGVNATVFGVAATAGGAASAVSGTASHTAPGALFLSVAGGAGGDGGSGGVFAVPANGNPGMAGDGGAGGRGAAATGLASITSVTSGALDAAVQSVVAGGNGGRGGSVGQVCDDPASPATCYFFPPNAGFSNGGLGGDGGAAFSDARAVASGAGKVEVKAVARGGNGGSLTLMDYLGAGGGNGGGAVSSARGQSDTGRVSVTAEAFGGDGGGGELFFAPGGRGGAVQMIDAVSGSTRGELVLVQHAAGGAASLNDYQADTVRSHLTLSDAMASAISARVSARGVGAAAGAASAALTLASTRPGAALDGIVVAEGGAGGSYEYTNGPGGRADAAAQLTGLGDVRGSAVAVGGNGGMSREGWSHIRGGDGGDAAASLTLSAGGLATGAASASGGRGGNGDDLYSQPQLGAASATLALAGAGARGVAQADGRSADSTVSARTSGALDVDVTATARVASAGGNGNSTTARAVVDVASGADAARAGTARVTARALASSADDGFSAPATSVLDVRASGAIDGVSEARSGNASYDWRSGSDGAGEVASSARGVTSGAHAVLLSAVAQAGNTQFLAIHAIQSAGASATAFGQSGSGAVDVSAVARASGGDLVYIDSYPGYPGDRYGRASATATAVNLERGGRGTARATIWGGDGDVLASASGIGRGGALLRVSGAGATLPWTDETGWVIEPVQRSFDGSAQAGNFFEASAFALADVGGAGTRIVSHVNAAPELPGAVGALGPVVSGAMASLTGVGMQALGVGPNRPDMLYGDGVVTASGRFEFDGAAGRHLLLGLVSSAFSGGFGTLELSVSNHGVALFSRLFTSADEASLFFGDRVLDLGLFGAGMQDVLVSSIFSASDPGTFAFNYVLGDGAAFPGLGGVGVGVGVGVTAVPEASTWLMLVLGLGAVLAVAGRRRHRPAHMPAACRA